MVRFPSTFRVTAPLGDASITCRAMDGSFEPELIQKGQTRIDGMDDKIIALYAAGLSTRDIRAHLEEVYGLKVSADLISRVTDAVLEEVSDWQNRALEPMYPIVFLDALRVKIRDAPSRDIAAQYPAGQWKAARSKTRPYMWPWASPRKASARFWVCGSQPTKVPNSGSQL